MDNGDVSTKEGEPTARLETTASGDPGDEKERNFRYQHQYGVVLLAAARRRALNYVALYCEHHEDFLAELASIAWLLRLLLLLQQQREALAQIVAMEHDKREALKEARTKAEADRTSLDLSPATSSIAWPCPACRVSNATTVWSWTRRISTRPS